MHIHLETQLHRRNSEKRSFHCRQKYCMSSSRIFQKPENRTKQTQTRYAERMKCLRSFWFLLSFIKSLHVDSASATLRKTHFWTNIFLELDSKTEMRKLFGDQETKEQQHETSTSNRELAAPKSKDAKNLDSTHTPVPKIHKNTTSPKTDQHVSTKTKHHIQDQCTKLKL